MRQFAILVVLVGCTAGAPERQAAAPKTAPKSADLVCPSSEPSGLRGRDPKDGGYLVLRDDAAVDALSKAGSVDRGRTDDQRRFDALSAAMSDMRAELKTCFRAADNPRPETQYEVVLTLTGDSAGSRVIGTSVKRVDGVNPDHTPVLAKTDAEACVARLFAKLALPPGNGLGESHTFVRSDFCMPTVGIASATVGVYADAYRRWSADHRGTTCPAALADLNSYARRTSIDDPWSQPYVMRCSADAFEVLSAGPDRRIGTADDLTSRR